MKAFIFSFHSNTMILFNLVISLVVLTNSIHCYQLYAEGYYPFEEGPDLTPPAVRKPPYTQTNAICSGTTNHLKPSAEPSIYNTLCGDLNKGFLPRNPMDQLPLGQTYPFDLIRNKTLEYLSEVLPLLREDNTIPKVAKFQGQVISGGVPRAISKRAIVRTNVRTRRTKIPLTKDQLARLTTATDTSPTTTVSSGRGFCDGSNGFLCKFITGIFPPSPKVSNIQIIQPKPQPQPPPPQQQQQHPLSQMSNRKDNPVEAMSNDDIHSIPITTPCPSKAEYATPLFAKNYQGLWRYVVQIPFEGYLTQTVEVTRCLQGQCNFVEGHCLASPRWVSLLVAEIFYPNAFFPTTPEPDHSNTVKRAPKLPLIGMDPPAPPVADFENFQQYLVKRASAPASTETKTADGKVDQKSDHCDGFDAIGCFQIRLFYDWFLIPGACKCWKPPAKSFFLSRSTT